MAKFTKRGPLASFWRNDWIGGWSLAEIVGTLAVLASAAYGICLLVC